MTFRGVLVVGATGTQGGAVATRLLDEGTVDVYALTRDPDSGAARELEDRGAIVVQGDLWEPGTLLDAMDPVDAVFAMTDYWEAGLDAEVSQGVNLANAAARADIDHVVFSSVVGATRDTDAPMLASKGRIESHLRGMDLPTTVLRPSYFMQNFELRRADVTDGTLALPLAPGTRLPLTDAVDLGRLVARILDAPERYRGKAIPLAGEELTLTEMAAVFGEALDRDLETVHVPIDVARSQVGDDYAALFEWYNDDAPGGLVGPLRHRLDFEPTPLSAYLDRNDWGRPELPGAWDAKPVQ
ncbi:NmrA/HSCARG family protein [Halorientalis salina]|uniref:NmrA/HSCARG family protein n=1 Tax=Halorientalis salina TaxID=2932266 RepID=UPI0010ABF6C5|nr:NmrA/HSCARG family protein [Halorientalis salina]